MTFLASLHEFILIAPELLLTIVSLIILLFGVFSNKTPAIIMDMACRMGIAALMVALVILIMQDNGEFVLFNGMIKVDSMTHMARSLILSGSLGVLWMTSPYLASEGLIKCEYVVLYLLATAGMMWMVSAHDFISLFMALELQALSIYVLCAMNKTSLATSEASSKYFILGALSTCLFLYGTSLVYGYTGTTNFDVLHTVLQLSQDTLSLHHTGILIGLSFIVASLCFKVSLVPFHMWTPDVYQGTPLPVTTFLATVSKAAALLLMIRIVRGPLDGLYTTWSMLLEFLVGASMILGALGALYQKDIKRLLAYSSIGQVGYILLGVIAYSDDGLRAALVNLTIYLFTMIGLFGLVLAAKPTMKKLTFDVQDLKGLADRDPLLATLISVFLLSLAGLPPLAGFFGKFYVFIAGIESHLYALVIIGVLASVVSTGYYLMIIKTMFFEESTTAHTKEKPGRMMSGAMAIQRTHNRNLTYLVYIAAASVLLFFIYPAPLVQWTSVAITSLVR